MRGAARPRGPRSTARRAPWSLPPRPYANPGHFRRFPYAGPVGRSRSLPEYPRAARPVLHFGRDLDEAGRARGSPTTARAAARSPSCRAPRGIAASRTSRVARAAPPGSIGGAADARGRPRGGRSWPHGASRASFAPSGGSHAGDARAGRPAGRRGRLQRSRGRRGDEGLRAEAGLRVPDDAAVVGFDDVPTAAWPEHDITTVRQGAGRPVEATADALPARIEDPGPAPRRAPIDGRPIRPGSTRAP